MIAYGPKRMFFSNQAMFEQPDGKFGILPAPSLEIMVESVHRHDICSENTHIAASDAGQPVPFFQAWKNRNPKNMVGITQMPGQSTKNQAAQKRPALISNAAEAISSTNTRLP